MGIIVVITGVVMLACSDRPILKNTRLKRLGFMPFANVTISAGLFLVDLVPLAVIYLVFAVFSFVVLVLAEDFIKG